MPAHPAREHYAEKRAGRRTGRYPGFAEAIVSGIVDYCPEGGGGGG